MGAFSKRHIGPNEAEKKAMLGKIGVNSVTQKLPNRGDERVGHA